MIITDIFERVSSKKEALQRQLISAKAELNMIQKQAADNANGSAAQYAPRIARAKAAIADINQKLEAVDKSENSVAHAHEFAKEFADKRAKETDEEKLKRHGKASTEGRDTADEQRDAHGGWSGLAAAVHKYVSTASNHGAEKVTADDIAHHFKVGSRSINKWLERSEFAKTARLMGRS